MIGAAEENDRGVSVCAHLRVTSSVLFTLDGIRQDPKNVVIDKIHE